MCCILQPKVHYNEKKLQRELFVSLTFSYLFVSLYREKKALRAKIESISIYLKCDGFIQDRLNRTTTI